METILNEQERHDLVTVLRELDPTAPHEHRRATRRKALMSIWIRRLGNSDSRALNKIVLVNVSQNGVGLLSKTSCPTGEKFVLPLRFDDGGGWLVLCEVRNCRRLASGQYKIGGRFIDRIEDDKGVAKIPGDWLV